MTGIDRERLRVLELLATLPKREWGRRLHAARRARGLTQTAAAEALGVTQPTYAGFEAGRKAPSAETLWRLASTLGLDPAILFAAPQPEPAMETAGADRPATGG